MATSKFWLYDWMDSNGIHTFNDAKKLLEEPRAFLDLGTLIADVPYRLEAIPKSDVPTVVAGRAIDLSGHLDCYAWECMRKQVDKLFSHVLHYFDRIVVVGPSAHDFSASWTRKNQAQVVDRLLNYVRLLLYIRAIGAEDLLLFREKPPACQIHLRQHLKQIGFERALLNAPDIIEGLARHSDISIEPYRGDFRYTFNHPEFEHTVWGNISMSQASGKSIAALNRAVAKSVYARYLAELTSDIRTAKMLDCPLGTTVKLHGQLLGSFKVGVTDIDVAFRLDLPILKDIEPVTLLKIRQDERISFDKFRQSLRIAIVERLNSSQCANPDAIAQQIRMDVIEPALTEIESRLAAAKTVLAKKGAISITLGSLATICGLLTADSLLTSAGVAAAVGGTLNASYKAIEEERDIRLSDMYFLWRTKMHSRKHV